MRTNQLTIGDLHQAIGCQPNVAGQCPSANIAIERIVTDSRMVRQGDVFWALQGAGRDGADFIDDAWQRGAAGVVTSRSEVVIPAGRFAVCVGDSLAALWALAAWKRRQFTGTAIGVTGSVGKSTTRQMIHTVLGSRFRGVASPRNFNNHVGLPLSMLALESGLDYAVFELAASAQGEIDQLARLCAPHVGVITRIAEAHLAGFGDEEAIARGKAELLSALPPDGTAILNGDCRRLRAATGHWSGKTLRFGKGADCDVIATDVTTHQGTLRFRVNDQPFWVPVWGRHHLTAALAAIAVGRGFDMRLEEIAKALHHFEALPLRCEIRESGSLTIINDTYNACPTSMRAAFELLRNFDRPGRRIVVCGDMRELGFAAAEMHRQLGSDAVSICGADLLVACGHHARDVIHGARKAGMSGGNLLGRESLDEVWPWLREAIQPGDVILIKGSRALAMERLSDWLEQESSRGEAVDPLRRLTAAA